MSQLPILKKYDFKSVGRTEVEFQEASINRTAGIPIGIKTPVELSVGSNAGPFRMNQDLGEQIKDNFRNMLATNHGDRVMLYDFGANLQELAFELGAEGGDVKAIQRIRTTTEKYMPFIQLETFEPMREADLVDSGMATIGVRVVYSVPRIQLFKQGVEVLIYTAG
jgi:phage baseplate assembly protein W